MSSLALLPSIGHGFYPERRSQNEPWLDRVATTIIGRITGKLRGKSRRFEAIVKPVNKAGEILKGMSEDELKKRVRQLQLDLKRKGFTLDLVAQSFALVREFSERRIGLRHYDVQLVGGWVILNGMVAEMETGEGKTLAATLPACTAALAGIPVHIITVNDYLAKRDAEWMGPIYEAFGLSVGTVTHEIDLEDRRKAYRCNVTYCTNKEIVFDYLKDRLVLGQQPGQIQMLLERLYSPAARLGRLRLTGLYFAIVDEADSILIDEARTPLIISGAGENTHEEKTYRQALELAGQLEPGKDYTMDRARKTLDLTETGRTHLDQLAQPVGGFWAGVQWREELVHQALIAQRLFSKDKDYLVRDNKVQIIDEFTGRLMPDRSWERGLHQLIEAKENCKITSQSETLARISYQRFFRRYLHLAGMTGTAQEVARELWSVYRLRVVSVPTYKPLARWPCPPRVYRKAQEKWHAVTEKIVQLHKQGRPVLVGTRSVAASENLSRMLTKLGLPHRVLNARQDKEEADIISQAGQKAQITVATNMAGRGADIKIGVAVKELGGLHVIATERHEARRIDRQLFGRCGRQGDPGTFEAIASMEDEVLAAHLDTLVGRILCRWLRPDTVFGRWISDMFVAYAQRKTERKHFLMRRDLMKLDESMESVMAFSGHSE